MQVLIGSRALAFWNPSLKLSEDTDWDVITDSYVPMEHPLIEWHSADFLNNRDMMEYSSCCHVELPDGTVANVMNRMGLAIIKRSHLWRDLSFNKHITHYHKFGLRKQFDGWSPHIVFTDLEVRTKLTKEAFPQGNPNLMQTKKDFFDDAVAKKYDHDYLHELVAFYEKPLYNNLLRNPDLAWCDEDKWNLLSHEDQVKCVAEETFVISIERFMVPNDWDYPSKLAYMKALRKVCTTLCSGWFRDFAIDYYPEVLSMYNHEVFNKVKGVLHE